MDWCAVFVDAGWFLAEAAQGMTGRGSRRAVACDYGQLTSMLCELAEESARLPLLRMYWYDAAPDGIPGPEHLDIARLANVKLRLGRISHNEQKGVDALLILDLTTLARERAIAKAVVFSGDEDIREGIAAAQSLGVRVTLGGVELEGRRSQATTLVNEADDHLLVDCAFLERSIRVPEPSRAPAVGAAFLPEPTKTPRTFGYSFGAAYADRLEETDLRMLQREAPVMPADAIAQLFNEAERQFGPLRGRNEIRRELKAGFWDHVMQRR